MDQTIKVEDNDNKDEDNNNNANTDGDNGSNNPTINKPQERHQRKRKKRLLTAIRQQIEFYFSDANLRHDRFMRQLIGAEDPEHNGQKPVDLTEFLKFNRISELTTNIRDIGLALDRSVGLELDDNRLTVRRSQPFTAGSVNTDDQTLYVERLPPTADQQWLWSVFGTFGKIQYVKIPRFKNNNQIMGFAFVEFEDKLSAEKALKHFTAESNPQVTDDNKCENKDAKEVVEEEDTKVSEQQTDNKVVKTPSKVLGGKRPLKNTTDDKEEDIAIGEEVERKRTKLSDDNDNQKPITSEQSESNSMVIVNNNEMTMKKTSDGEIDTKLKTTTKKKKKKRKKKKSIAADFVVEDNNNNNNNNDNDNNHQNHHHQQHHHHNNNNNNNHNNTNKSSEVINLRVMSKHEWKSWKKRYLQLQKQTMSSLKKSLEVMDNNNEKQQRQTTDGKTVGDTNNDIVVAVDRSYDKGLIIKLNFKVASQEFNENQFKRNVRQMAEKREISYIDLQTNQLEFVDSQTIQGLCYIRTVSQDVCQRLVADERLRQLGGGGDGNSVAAVVLDGNEESDYWAKIFDERSKLMAYQQKYNYNTNNNNNNNKNINNKKSRHNKIRGFDKIINRADNQLMTTNVDNNNTKKVNKHIKFD